MYTIQRFTNSFKNVVVNIVRELWSKKLLSYCTNTTYSSCHVTRDLSEEKHNSSDLDGTRDNYQNSSLQEKIFLIWAEAGEIYFWWDVTVFISLWDAWHWPKLFSSELSVTRDLKSRSYYYSTLCLKICIQCHSLTLQKRGIPIERTRTGVYKGVAKVQFESDNGSLPKVAGSHMT